MSVVWEEWERQCLSKLSKSTTSKVKCEIKGDLNEAAPISHHIPLSQFAQKGALFYTENNDLDSRRSEDISAGADSKRALRKQRTRPVSFKRKQGSSRFKVI